ncbi:MAG: choice-of-anchor J domain-containing protein [Bacteroidales bacterium]|nr:choice-of-anchor J domain-containing protein [Bacteroidales bacterium]
MKLILLLTAFAFATTSVAQEKPTAPLQPMQSAADGALIASGAKPLPTSISSKATSGASRLQASRSTTYPYAGYNAAFELSDDSYSPGWVQFKLEPFAFDQSSITLCEEATPYSYLQGDKLYSFAPVAVYNSATYDYEYPQIIRTTFDANTLELLDQQTFENPTGEMAYVPYIMTYDTQRDVVWAISMENGYDENWYSYSKYYLNLFEPETCQLKRMGYLGTWSSANNSGNYNPKALTAFNTGGTLYVQLYDETLDIATIEPLTCTTEVIGSTSMPTEYVYGLQPMIYDAESGYLLIDHYDFNQGTSFWKVAPWIAWGATDNVCESTLLEYADTGYTNFYRRPETVNNYYTYTLDSVTDAKAEDLGDGKVEFTYTVPNTCDGGNAIEIPSWSYNTVRAYYYMDNNYVSADANPEIPKLGEEVTVTFSDVPGGVHVFTVILYPNYNELKGNNTGVVLLSGYDAPAEVTNATLTFEGQVAHISWSAPTTGLHADFGNAFDSSDITYTVVRDFDGKVIAQDITETATQDNDISDIIRTYTYTIYATSHGSSNNGATTNKVSAGKYIELPYSNSFDDINSVDSWTILNVAGDEAYIGWQYNNYYGYMYATSNTNAEADDWLIAPAVDLKADKLYQVGFVSHTWEGYPVSFNVDLLSKAERNATVQNISAYTNWDSEGEDYNLNFYFNPEEDGNYNVGVQFYGYTEAMLSLDNFILKEIAPVSAPDSVTGLKVQAMAEGLLGFDISCRLPETSIDGNKLTSLSAVNIYDADGNLLQSATDVEPGQEFATTVYVDKGKHSFTIVAANENGEGWPTAGSVYVGYDVPSAVNDFTLSWSDVPVDAGYAVTLSWTAPTQGKNGGFVETEDLVYTIYKYDDEEYDYIALGEVIGETSVDVTILDAADEQDQYLFAITATNELGESDYTKGSIVLGKPYELPINEPFSMAYDALLYHPYILISGISDQNWALDFGYYNDCIQPYQNDGIDLVLAHHATGEGSGFFQLPIVDFSSAAYPLLSVYLHHSDAMPEDATVSIYATLDGSKVANVEIAPAQSLSGNNGWQQHIFDLSEVAGHKAQISLYGYMPNQNVRIFADNFSIFEAEGSDLALLGLQVPYLPTTGEIEIAAKVANLGKEDMNGYVVKFMLEDEEISSVTGNKLASGETASLVCTLNVSQAQPEMKLSAVLECEEDQNLANNTTEAELKLASSQLPAPTDLSFVENSCQLSWMAPDFTSGWIKSLDCEELPAFQLDNFDGWTTVDGDGHLTLTFTQYSGNYWPNAGQQLAWMVWSAREAGAPTAEIWQPYEGEKCLIHFGNYGIDADGRSNEGEAEDDWLISPQIAGGSTFSFWASTCSTENVDIEVLTSSAGNSPEDFTNKVGNLTFNDYYEWTYQEFSLPEDAKYVAIHVVADDFGTMIDNIKYTSAEVPQLQGYNVYRYNSLVGTATDTSYMAADTQSHRVTAVYDLGESACSNEAGTSGINSAQITKSMARAIGGKGVIEIYNAGGNLVELYAANGMLLRKEPVNDNATWNVTTGLYIIRISNATFKLSVE